MRPPAPRQPGAPPGGTAEPPAGSRRGRPPPWAWALLAVVMACVPGAINLGVYVLLGLLYCGVALRR